MIQQSARKKLENRRLAYDASLAKMQKTKREDFRVEEELRIQKAKFEEASEDVYRRMQDVSRKSSPSRSQVLIQIFRLKKPRSIASMILGHFWMQSSTITTGAVRCYCN